MREAAVELKLEAQALPVLQDTAGAAGRRPRAPSCAAQGVPAERIVDVRRVHLRYEGTDSALIVPAGEHGGDAGRSSRRPTASATRS